MNSKLSLAKSLQVFSCLALTKAVITLMRIVGYKASHFPGTVAHFICPDILQHLRLPKPTVGVSGTNGKTTVCNLLVSCLRDEGLKVLENSYGSNTMYGIMTAIIQDVNMRGESRSDCAVLEIDELSTRRIFPAITPDYMVITNIYRDSYQRNAHPDFIFETLAQNIPLSTVLILNGEDSMLVNLAPQNRRLFFGIAEGLGPLAEGDELIRDAANCPDCRHAYVYSSRRNNHIGHFFCPHCGKRNPDFAYELAAIDPEDNSITIREGDKLYRYSQRYRLAFQYYNTLALIACLRELKLAPERIEDLLAPQSIIESRFEEFSSGGRVFNLCLAKALNPISSSRVLDYVVAQPGRKAVFLFNTFMLKDGLNNENTAWLFETDFEKLNRPDIAFICIGARRKYDYKLRLRLAGIPDDKIKLYDGYEIPFSELDFDGVDGVYTLHDINNSVIIKDLIHSLAAELSKKEPEL